MLCKASDGLPAGGDWLYEVKWDGYRCIARVEGGSVTLQSRSSKPLSFPNIEDALAELVDGVVDGEIVAVLDGEGRSSFAVL